MRAHTLTLVALPLLAACTSVPEQPGQCDAAPAQSLLGEPYTEALGAKVQELTGSTILRPVHEGDPVTEDYRLDRVTVVWNDGRKVVKISCG
ncbi:hypothetical protein D2V17_04525 [Aurantiacibacter xanthus]|uniref:Peptidase inhibitor I78 n=1 Tax=Aurantiacibacter xanthus TaxID=1784712 RepID=A0A3A1P9E5_9SPHN|nr:I78 family peptidase inhibitor [Aurantiacibacter xanthus]RIV90347.1 hypothetical protein D2V17_04525 [Aurantiacibacter xanthus]